MHDTVVSLDMHRISHQLNACADLPPNHLRNPRQELMQFYPPECIKLSSPVTNLLIYPKPYTDDLTDFSPLLSSPHRFCPIPWAERLDPSQTMRALWPAQYHPIIS